jgi:DNA-binding NtrC family response regulator
VIRPQRVLVLEGASETADVLRELLAADGTVVERIRGHRVAHTWSVRPQPSVVVVDLDETPPQVEPPVWHQTPHVLIGSTRVPLTEPGAAQQSVTETAQKTRFLEKPYQVPALVAAVKDLLADQRRAA